MFYTYKDKEMRTEISKIKLRDVLDIIIRNTVELLDGLEAFNVILKFNIEG